MRTAVVGGGLLGAALARGLAAKGQEVTLFEAERELGGLCRPRDYGPFHWDRFYHCILPQDRALLTFLADLGLRDAVRWRRTRTGYWARGRTYPLDGPLDLLRFPLLGLRDKLRLGLAMRRAAQITDPRSLYTVSAAEWLRRTAGPRAFETFWQPLQRAKFGPYADRVAAVFLWATTRRLIRRTGGPRHRLGYVSGGYARVLARIIEDLLERGVQIRTGCPVLRIRPAGPGASVTTEAGDENFDHVVFTGPTERACRCVEGSFAHRARVFAERRPAGRVMLGVVDLVVALQRPLTPFYVLNLGEGAPGLTGVVGLSNLVDPESETAGYHLVHFPCYLPAEDPAFDAPDEELRARLFEGGARRLFPDLERGDVASLRIERARRVQPLPLVGPPPPEPARDLRWRPPFQIVNSALLAAATLNNSEILKLASDFLEGVPAARA